MSLVRRGSSDVDALDRSFRSRISLLGVVCMIAIGLATWSALRETGRGAVEDPRRVLIITADGHSGIETLSVVERAGFVAEVEDLAGWEARAREYVNDEDVHGLALVLEFADLGGYGFVVIEQPGRFEYAELELEPAPDEIDAFAECEFAALSVGDLAFPHQLSVDDPGEDPLLRMPSHGALQAIYRQPRLAPDREILVQRPTVEELKIEAAIRTGRKLVDTPVGFPTVLDQVITSENAALAGDGAKTLVEPLNTGSPLPIAGGGTLLLRHDLVVYSDDALTLELDSGEWLTIDWLSPEALAAGDPSMAVRCTDLLGGAIRLDRQPSFEVSRDGKMLAISSERDGSRVWRKLDEPGCRFVELGELPKREPDEITFGALAPDFSDPAGPTSPVLARVGRTETGARLRTWTAGEGAWTLTEQVVLELPEVELRMPIFLDRDRMALLSRSRSPEATLPPVPIDALHIVDRRRPASHLRIPAEFIGEGLRLRELAWLPPDPSAAAQPWNLQLLVTTVDPQGKVSVLELALTEELAAIVDLAMASPVVALPDALPGPELKTIAPGDLVVRRLVERDDLYSVTVDPQGRWLALVVGDPLADDTELAVFDRLASGGTVRTLTDNGLRDHLPRFTSEGRQIVFSSMMRVWISGRTFTVPRVVALPN